MKTTNCLQIEENEENAQFYFVDTKLSHHQCVYTCDKTVYFNVVNTTK